MPSNTSGTLLGSHFACLLIQLELYEGLILHAF